MPYGDERDGILEQEKMRREERNRVHDRLNDAWDQSGQAAVDTGLQTAKIVIGINGGAVGGILAFVGGLAAKNVGGVLPLAQTVAYFAAGVFAGALCLAFGFLTNYAHGATVKNIARTPSYPFTEETTDSAIWLKRVGLFTWLSVGSGIVGLVSFVVGAVAVLVALGNLTRL
jgi:hypothetical protein